MRFTPATAQVMQEALFARAIAIVGPKRRDYAGTKDPFANFRSSEIVGVEPWRGAMVRWLDKVQRMRQLAEQGGAGQVKSESLVDTAADALNYAALAFLLIVETLPQAQAEALLSELGG